MSKRDPHAHAPCIGAGLVPKYLPIFGGGYPGFKLRKKKYQVNYI